MPRTLFFIAGVYTLAVEIGSLSLSGDYTF
jgi:hypothetical protein